MVMEAAHDRGNYLTCNLALSLFSLLRFPFSFFHLLYASSSSFLLLFTSCGYFTPLLLYICVSASSLFLIPFFLSIFVCIYLCLFVGHSQLRLFPLFSFCTFIFTFLHLSLSYFLSFLSLCKKKNMQNKHITERSR